MSDTTPSLNNEQSALLNELISGVQKVLENAEQLFREACLLRENGAHCRALFLHQISMEECGKVEQLGWCATNLFLGKQADPSQISARLSQHKSKNFANAYFLRPTTEEQQARVRGDWKEALEVFSLQQSRFHEESNTAKNASLYVDYVDGSFHAPLERITDGMVLEIASTNQEFLQLTRAKVEVLHQWKMNPGAAIVSITKMTEEFEEIKSNQSRDTESTFEKLFEKVLFRMTSSDEMNDGINGFEDSANE